MKCEREKSMTSAVDNKSK